MMYKIEVTLAAREDIDEYIDYITNICAMPLAAAKIYDSLFEKIYAVAEKPLLYAVREGLWYMKFGAEVRRVNFKTRAIIYTVENNIMTIHRVASQSEIYNP